MVLTWVLGWRVLRQGSAGIPAWHQEAVNDRSLPSLQAGTPQEWLAGRSPLGSGGKGSFWDANARALWWEPPFPRATAILRFTVTPAPAPGQLRKATRKVLRAARR
ncbi:MAG: hypothetical protein QOG31_1695, partial [Thermoplasmata archaeon]|nr:hypothetical protein [Thermoplasmata archaeon]